MNVLETARVFLCASGSSTSSGESDSLLALKQTDNSFGHGAVWMCEMKEVKVRSHVQGWCYRQGGFHRSRGGKCTLTLHKVHLNPQINTHKWSTQAPNHTWTSTVTWSIHNDAIRSEKSFKDDLNFCISTEVACLAFPSALRKPRLKAVLGRPRIGCSNATANRIAGGGTSSTNHSVVKWKVPQNGWSRNNDRPGTGRSAQSFRANNC